MMDYTVPTDLQLNAAPWMRYAIRWIGIAELPGDQDNPTIVKWIKECAPKTPRLWHDVTPHCSAFANACMRNAGLPGTGSLAARSWLRWGIEVPISEARYGDVLVLWRGVRVPGPIGPGHVTFFDRSERGMLYGLGGNQKNRVGVDPYAPRRVLSVRRWKP